ncbi:hypothetical protein [Paenibacillus sp. FSL H8-0259]|uniref:hypothetical protein n=1 Tax=Paenibacillus sp. FSL H8-0259 TaxID=1920423 RepID=UPI00096E66DD|nr:hypothetical protein [Paenibacillus sp. FSL H8-0259]OMF21882.1 hypothetical protein BK132_31630 [Paenibacillus sp. FSL H8-0259]
MATYESHYQQLGFYVDGGFRRFSGGLFHTDDPAEIAVLDALVDAVRISEEPQAVADTPAEEVTAIKPAPKPRRTSAK